MKTVSERQQELAEKTSKVNAGYERRANLWRVYLQSVVARDIQPYQPTEKNANDELIDRTEYSELRKSHRGHISVLKQAERDGFINTACDGCKTVLFDASPSMILTSNPPKFWADCIGCGKRYALELSLRKYVDPPETTPTLVEEECDIPQTAKDAGWEAVGCTVCGGPAPAETVGELYKLDGKCRRCFEAGAAG